MQQSFPDKRDPAAHSAVDREVCLAPRRKKDFLCWETAKGPGYSKSIRILTAPNISRRGMRLIYGQCDHFGNRPFGLGKLSYGFNMLLRKDGCLFVLFYSPVKRVTYRSYELIGLKLPPLPERGQHFQDDCVPEVLRDLYEEWVSDCLDYPDEID